MFNWYSEYLGWHCVGYSGSLLPVLLQPAVLEVRNESNMHSVPKGKLIIVYFGLSYVTEHFVLMTNKKNKFIEMFG